jgi:hypothetical protein
MSTSTPPAALGDLVRLALGLPDPGETLSGAMAAVGVRAGLHLDGHRSSEDLRVNEIARDRAAVQERERAQERTQAVESPTAAKPSL